MNTEIFISFKGKQELNTEFHLPEIIKFQAGDLLTPSMISSDLKFGPQIQVLDSEYSIEFREGIPYFIESLRVDFVETIPLPVDE